MGNVKKESDIKVGCVYRYTVDQSIYLVFLGRIAGYWHEWQIISWNEYVPKDATLETYPLSKMGHEFLLYKTGVADIKCLTYLGKICEPTEQAIKVWLTQIKLSGYVIDGKLDSKVVLGDCKLPKVRNFGVGKYYVEEALAFRRLKILYQYEDTIWRYCGKEGQYYVWDAIDYFLLLIDGENAKYERHKYTTQLRNMVVFRPDKEGYQQR
jgi:hypothetical protein